MKLKFLAGEYAICQFSPDQQIPDWILDTPSELLATMKTADELTVVFCPQNVMPEGTKSSLGWCCFRIDETLSFDQVGVIAKLTAQLAHTKIPVFVVSTYNTDYVLIPGPRQQQAKRELKKAGYDIV